jgi:hypothetical protein
MDRGVGAGPTADQPMPLIDRDVVLVAVHQSCDPLQVITLGGQLPQPLRHIEEPRLIHHRPHPNRDQESESALLHQSQRFLEAPNCSSWASSVCPYVLTRA